MAAPTMRYLAYNFTACYLQYNVAGTLTEVATFYPNKFSIKADDENIVFEGGGNKKTVYVTTGMTVEFTADAINVAAAGTVFGKTNVTTSVPNSGSNLNWFGELTESAGITAGLRAVGSATKDVAGTQTTVNINLWIPQGTLTLAPIDGVETAKKWGGHTFRLGATRATTDAAGVALPSVPAGGAFYGIYET